MTFIQAVLFVGRDALWSGMAALGFAILFNVPVRALFPCAMGGATGHLIRTLLMEWGMGIEIATLVGATVVGFLGEISARRWHAPASVFTVPAVIPMVPGVFAFSTMIGILTIASQGNASDQTLLIETAVNASKTLLILGAIAIGIAAPILLVHRHRLVK